MDFQQILYPYLTQDRTGRQAIKKIILKEIVIRLLTQMEKISFDTGKDCVQLERLRKIN